ncbi:MAG: nitrilase-related carbon-nitrogen hydrolase [Pseudomonadota bacterium]
MTALTHESYYAMAYQAPCHAVNAMSSRDETGPHMLKVIADLKGKLRQSKLFVGPDLKLIVLPEYVLTSYPAGESIAAWKDKAALDMDGPEYDALGAIAQELDIYLSGNAYEADPHFPQLYFQTSFIISPAGDVILRYRRLNSMFAPTPHDVWDRYLDIYSLDEVFPVADTEIGRLACVASEEILYPEISRCHALRGAEVLCHSSSEVGSPTETPKQLARRARGMENMAYVISANTAGIFGSGFPGNSADGNSAIIGPLGNVMAEANTGETMIANAEVDIHALRRKRRRPGMSNYLARQRLEAFADSYLELAPQRKNGLLGKDGGVKEPDRAYFKAAQADVIEALDKAGRI